jgi:hypothetical protein
VSPYPAVVTLITGKKQAWNDAIANGQVAYSRAQGRDHPRRFMPKNVGQARNISVPFQNVKIGSANSAAVSLNEGLALLKHRQRNLAENEWLCDSFEKCGLHPTTFSPKALVCQVIRLPLYLSVFVSHSA